VNHLIGSIGLSPNISARKFSSGSPPNTNTPRFGSSPSSDTFSTALENFGKRIDVEGVQQKNEAEKELNRIEITKNAIGTELAEWQEQGASGDIVAASSTLSSYLEGDESLKKKLQSSKRKDELDKLLIINRHFDDLEKKYKAQIIAVKARPNKVKKNTQAEKWVIIK